MENQDSPPPLDPTLAPALLFEPVHGDGSGADEAGEDETTDDDGTRLFLYSKRRLLAVAGFGDYLNNDATWITPQGWVLVLDPTTRDASLRDPFASRTVRLPPDHHHLLPSSNENTRCLLSTHRPAADDDPAGRCIVLVVHLEEPVVWYCSPGPGSRWSRHEYPSELIVSDHDSIKGAMMSRLTAARGKFYTYVYGDGPDKIMALDFSPGPGPIFSSTHVLARKPFLSRVLEDRLVESCGDLFFVRFSLLGPPCCAQQAIAKICVYKLVLSANDAWEETTKVATLGDNRVFFFGTDFGASMAADEVGLKANCIYFTRGADKGLYVHDLERGTTTLHNPGTDVPDSVKPVLLMPACPS